MPQIYVIIAKPTRECNADCEYCSSPPDGYPRWTLEDFKLYIDKLKPHLQKNATWIWHGGEPMLMGPDFFFKCKEYTDNLGIEIYYSMQSNLLAYKDKIWKKCFSEVMKGNLSSSYDPDEAYRTLNGSPEKYSKNFWRAIDDVVSDDFVPLVIGTYTERTAPLAVPFYERIKSMGEKSFHLRFNYCNISGRYVNQVEPIQPVTYGQMLIDIYNKWIKDIPNFVVTPMDLMLKKIMEDPNEMLGRCPWTKSCGGQFIDIEPNGDIYNCSDFADLGDKKFLFGNLNTDSFEDIMNSSGAKLIKQRRYKTPPECQTCEHYQECEAGCMRDSILYNHGVFGKFHYCLSWKMIFTRIKESILTKEADAIIEKFGRNPVLVRNTLKEKMKNHFELSHDEISELSHPQSIFGYYANFPQNIQEKNMSESVEGLLNKKYYSSGYNKKIFLLEKT